MSKWNKWKLIHKETGLTFNQYRKKYRMGPYDYSDIKVFPVLLENGIPAFYIDEQYYPSLHFLENSEWRIEMKPATKE